MGFRLSVLFSSCTLSAFVIFSRVCNQDMDTGVDQVLEVRLCLGFESSPRLEHDCTIGWRMYVLVLVLMTFQVWRGIILGHMLLNNTTFQSTCID